MILARLRGGFIDVEKVLVALIQFNLKKYRMYAMNSKLRSLSCSGPGFKLRNFVISQLGFDRSENSLVTIYWYSSLSGGRKSLLSPAEAEQDRSFTVSYIVNSCGLSRESAISASKSVHFTTPDRPNSVLALLREHGFQNSDISKVISIYPRLLVTDPEKNLRPKIEFFRSKGFSGIQLVKILSFSKLPVLRCSLDKSIIPRFNFLKSVLLDDTEVASALKYSPWVFFFDVRETLGPNIELLRQCGVPQSVISFFVIKNITVLGRRREMFRTKLKEVIEMGFDPCKQSFVKAIVAMLSSSESSWERKREFYKKWGWSDHELSLAFRKNPESMIISEKKIQSRMHFLVNEMGFEAKIIAESVYVLSYNLEKRIIPRCFVVRLLQLKGLIKKDQSIYYFLQPCEKIFLEKFVAPYSQQVPHLLSLYKGEVGLFNLGLGPEDIHGSTKL